MLTVSLSYSHVRGSAVRSRANDHYAMTAAHIRQLSCHNDHSSRPVLECRRQTHAHKLTLIMRVPFNFLNNNMISHRTDPSSGLRSMCSQPRKNYTPVKGNDVLSHPSSPGSRAKCVIKLILFISIQYRFLTTRRLETSAYFAHCSPPHYSHS